MFESRQRLGVRRFVAALVLFSLHEFKTKPGGNGTLAQAVSGRRIPKLKK
jgi:hypothetical protein